MRPMLPIALAALLVLAGCGGTTADPTATSTPTPTATPSPTASATATATATPTSSPTATPTATPTSTPTATATPTPTPAPTATPRPDSITGGLRERIDYRTQGTTVEMELMLHEENEVITDLKPEYNESVEADEGETFVIATVEIENVGDRRLQLERSQWTLVDTNGATHLPHEAAMTRGADTVPRETSLRPDETAEYRVIVPVRNPYNVTYVQDPIIGADGPTVRLDPPA